MSEKKISKRKDTVFSEFGLPIIAGWLAVILLAITTIRSAILLSDYFVYMQFIALVLLSVTFLLFFFGLRRKYEDLWDSTNRVNSANEQAEAFREQQQETEALLNKQAQVTLRAEAENTEQSLQDIANEVIKEFALSGISIWIPSENTEGYEPIFMYRKHEGVLQKHFLRPFFASEIQRMEFPTLLTDPIKTLTEKHLRPQGIVQETVIPIRLANNQQALCCFENRTAKFRSFSEKNALSAVASMLALSLRLRYSDLLLNSFLYKNKFISHAIRKNLAGMALFRLEEPISIHDDYLKITKKLKTGQIPTVLEEYSHGLLTFTDVPEAQNLSASERWFSALNYDTIFPEFAERGFGKLTQEIEIGNAENTKFFQVFLAGIIENQKLVGWWHLQTDHTALKTELLQKRTDSGLFEKLYFSLLHLIPERYPSEGQKQNVLKKILPELCHYFGFKKAGIWQVNTKQNVLESTLVFDTKKARFVDDLQIEIDPFLHLNYLNQVFMFDEQEAENFANFAHDYRQKNDIQSLIVLPIRHNKITQEIVLLEDSQHQKFDQQHLELFQKTAHLISIYATFIDNRNALTDWKTEGKSYRGLLKNTDYAIAKFSLDVPISLKTEPEKQFKAIRELALLTECNAEMKNQLKITEIPSGFSFGKLIGNQSEIKQNLLFFNILNAPFRYTDTESSALNSDGKEQRFLESYIAIIEGDFITGIWILQREVTRLTRDEASILRSEKQYRTLTKFQRDAVGILNSKGFFVYVNPRFTEIFELKFSEVKAKKITDFIYPDDENRFNLILQKIKQNPETSQTIETQFLNQSGMWRNVELFLSNESNDTIVLSLRDISQQRKTETTSGLRAERLRKIFDANADPIFIINPKGRIIFANQEAHSTTGRPLHEISSHWTDFIHDADQSKASKLLEKVQLSIAPVSEFVRFRNDHFGAWRNVRIYAQNYVKDPALKGILVQLTDLQDYRLENRNLVHKLNRRNHLLETVREGIAVLDSEGNFRYANRAFAQILGVDLGEQLIKQKANFKDFLPAESQEIAKKFEEILRKSELNFSEGFYLQKSESEQIWVEGFMVNLLRNEHVSGIIFGIWENTNQKHHLDYLIDTEESLHLFLKNSAQISAFTDLKGRIYSSAGFDQLFGKPESEHQVFDSKFYPESEQYFIDESFRRVGEDGLSFQKILKRKNNADTHGDYLHILRKVQNSETGKNIVLADFLDKTELIAREADLRFHKQILEDERLDKKQIIAQHQKTVAQLQLEKEQSLQQLLDKKNTELETLNSEKQVVIQNLQKNIQLLSLKLSATEKPALLGRTLANIASVLQKPILEIRANLPELRRMLEEFREISDKYTEINPEIDLKAKLKEIQLLKDIADFENLNQQTDGLLAKQATLTENLVQISDNLMLFSKLQGIYQDKLNLNKLINNILQLMSDSFGTQIEIVKKYAERAEIAGYEDQIGQLLICLLNNAREAIPEHGYIFIDTWNTPNAIGISLKDTGLGMNTATQKQIFERFFTTKNPDDHSGTGLYLAQEIAQNHGATLEVESEQGKGTKITVIFPKEI